jgi:GxxExxY protein
VHENELSEAIIGAAIEVHRVLGGPGLLEDVYEQCLCRELSIRGLRFERQVEVPVVYKGCSVRKPLFLDIVVEDKVIVEVKATEKYNTIYESQLLTYLRLTDLRLGLVINFGDKRVSDGVHRVVNGL